MAGIAQINRAERTMPVATEAAQQLQATVGQVASEFDLLRSTQVLKTIVAEQLLENSKRAGMYLCARLRALDVETDAAPVSGAGCLIGASRELLGKLPYIQSVRVGRGRLMPPLTVSQSEIDEALRDPDAPCQ